MSSRGTGRSNGALPQTKICQFKLVLLGDMAVGKSSLVLLTHCVCEGGRAGVSGRSELPGASWFPPRWEAPRQPRRPLAGC